VEQRYIPSTPRRAALKFSKGLADTFGLGAGTQTPWILRGGFSLLAGAKISASSIPALFRPSMALRVSFVPL